MLVGWNEESVLSRMAGGAPLLPLPFYLCRLTQCLRVGGWVGAFSVGFVATAGVIGGIWPSAGIAVKAVATSELRGGRTHAHTCTHTCNMFRTHTYTPAGVVSNLPMHVPCTHTQTNDNTHTHTCIASKLWRYAI